MSSIDRPSQGVKTLKNYYDTRLINFIIGRPQLMERVERKPNVAACEHQRRRPAYTSTQSDQRLNFVVRSQESIIDKLAPRKISAF